MADDERSANEGQYWDRLYAAYGQYAKAKHDFLLADIDRVPLLKTALQHFETIQVVLEIMPLLPESEQTALFDELLILATSPRWVVKARAAIASLPREWVIANIEKAIEPILEEDPEWGYWRMLEVCFELDHGLTRKLAQKALNHPDLGVKEAGQSFLETLAELQEK